MQTTNTIYGQLKSPNITIKILSIILQAVLNITSFYSIAHVQAIGRQLSPPFGAEFSDPSKGLSLKYDAEEFGTILRNISRGHNSSS